LEFERIVCFLATEIGEDWKRNENHLPSDTNVRHPIGISKKNYFTLVIYCAYQLLADLGTIIYF